MANTSTVIIKAKVTFHGIEETDEHREEKQSPEAFKQAVLEELETLKAIYGEELLVSFGYKADLPTGEVEENAARASDTGYDVEVLVGISCSLSPELHNGLKIYVAEGYPDTPARIHVPSSLNMSKNEIEGILASSYGLPHLHLIFDWIKSSLTSLSNEENDSQDTHKPSSNICRFFMEGKCRFGDQWHNVHPKGKNVKERDKITPSQSSVVPPCELKVNDNTEKLTMASLDRKSETKTSKKHNVSDGKKKAMKTALDVISRIQWDPELKAENFSVGYLDRFIGIIEKSFNSFSWEDIASVDYNVLAIPKHRIQYFKYKDIIVWDKRVRMDKVFGSTDEEETLADIIQRSDEAVVSDKEEATCTPSKDIQGDILDFDSDEEFDDTIDDNVCKKNQGNRPNHFICFKVTNNEIKAQVKQVQENILRHDDRLQEGFIGQNELHVTLCMLRLNDEEEKGKVLNVLKDVQRLLVCMLPSLKTLCFDKLNNFRGRVLHVEIRSEPILAKMVDLLMLKLRDVNVELIGNYDVYVPHLTIAKMSRPMCRKMNTSQIYRKYYEKFEDVCFGHQPINGLLLCSTGKSRGQDGFYETFGNFPNTIKVLSDHLPQLLSNRIETLMTQGILKQNKGTILERCLHSKDHKDFDLVIKEVTMCSQVPPDDTGNIVIIMRGLPGSGKSSLLRNSSEFKNGNMTICSADEFFHSQKMGYKFDPLSLVRAHRFCQEQFIDALDKGVKLIAIDNTNSQLWEYEVYKRLAVGFGYRPQVFELSCQSTQDLELVSQRCLHQVGMTATKSMWKNWMKDTDSIYLNVKDCPKNDLDFTLTELLKLGTKSSTSIHGKGILYSALYLDDASKEKLMRCYPPVHHKVSGSHVTLLYNPMREQIPYIPVGKSHSVKIIGYVTNDLVQVAAVEERGEVYCTTSTPHITLSTSSKAAPKHAVDILADRHKWKLPSKEIILTGKIGVQVATSEKHSETITNSEMFTGICEQLEVDVCKSSLSLLYKSMLNFERQANLIDVDIVQYDDSHAPSSLLVFDFDGTLFDSPGPEKGKKIFEEKTGIAWPYGGYISVPQSLEYPLQCFPGPAFADYKGMHGSVGSTTVIMTARIEKTRESFMRVLEEYGIGFSECYMKPDVSSGRACKTVPKYKRNTLKGVLNSSPSVTNVRIWEDREENLHAMQVLVAEYKHISFDLIKVPDKWSAKDVASPMSCLEAQVMNLLQVYGVSLSPEYKVKVSKVLRFVGAAWAAVLNVSEEVALPCLLPFGSVPLNRKADLDLCLVAPRQFSVKECFEKLKSELEKRGISYIHVAFKIRCPRMKCQVQFNKGPPLDVDIIIACCLTSMDDVNVDRDLHNWHRDADKKEKVALEGPLFLRSILDLFKNEKEREFLGRVIDFVVMFLKASHMKGNAFHCIRTYHVVKALVNMVEGSDYAVEALDDFIVDSLRYFSELTLNDWSQLCKDFVPAEYFPYLTEAFQNGLENLKRSNDVWTLMERSEFPPKGTFCVTITVKSDDPVLNWKCSNLLEARIGTYIRKIINQGVEVFPGPSDYSNTVSFAVNKTERSEDVVREIIGEFRKDFQNGNESDKVSVTVKLT